MNTLAIVGTAALLCCGVAQADVIPPSGRAKQEVKPMPPPRPATSSREPAVVARQNPMIAALLKQARAAGRADAPANPQIPTTDESVIQVPLGGQCGFAGCSSSTLVAFTYRTRGANPTTNSVLVLVACESVPTVPCTAVRAEVRATSSPNPTQ